MKQKVTLTRILLLLLLNSQVKELSCDEALKEFKLHIISYFQYYGFQKKSESEVNYLMENIGFDFYKPDIKNFIDKKEDDEDSFEILSVIGNYYYYYYYNNNQLVLEKDKAIIIDCI